MKRALLDAVVLVACVVALVAGLLRPLRRLLGAGQRFSLWAGTPILNMATNARAERLLGCRTKSLVYETYYITSAFDIDLSRWCRNSVGRWLVSLAAFVWACFRADRLHFYCDRGLLPSRGRFTFDKRELVVYRLLGIPVFLWTYGADIRSRRACQSMGEPNCCTGCDAPGRYCICDDDVAARNQVVLARWSTARFAGIGDMFPYTPGSIDDVYFWPVDLDADGGRRYQPQYPAAGGERLRIVHAANHRKFKGTDHLVKAVEQLKAEGLPIELVLVERMSNEKALEIYRSADLIFDQCLMGNHGYFALEAMALGKPVMCFIRHPDRYLLAPEACPIINTHVATLVDDLRRVFQHRERLPEIGRRGRDYIEQYFSMRAFADRLSRAYLSLGVAL